MDRLISQAIELARQLQNRATELQTEQEHRQQAELDKMLQAPADKATLVQLTDQAFRARSPARVADQFNHILHKQGVPRFFSPLDRAMLHGFQWVGGWLPAVSVPLVKEHMQHETENVILPAEPELLAKHLHHRRDQGVRMNVNFLGEAILSEHEAKRRLLHYLEALTRPTTEVLSVKISTLYSQMSPLARQATIDTLCDRLEVLYRQAAQHTFVRADGTQVPKFIYLDMEEYRDLSLTCETFMRTLQRPGMEGIRAGIVLQAYIPDSYLWQQVLNEWARKRVAAGGAEITLRIVKGANLEMERHEASVKGWPQAPFETKRETDANYKRMLHEGFRAENLAAVRLGIASHNVFDVAYALALVTEHRAAERVQFEMLEGMANPQRRALLEQFPHLLLYAPVCDKAHFLSAIGYLIRRLDENTGPENFLRHAFHLQPGSEVWQQLEEGFTEAFSVIPKLASSPRRSQDRCEEKATTLPSPTAKGWQQFSNEPDTDWSLPHHSEWAAALVEKWQARCGESAMQIPVVVDGAEVFYEQRSQECLDPSRPGVVVARYSQATAGAVDEAVACAVADTDGWRSLSAAERKGCLQKVAQEIRLARADLMGAALAQGGKTLTESDPEVSEAVDFVEFYAESARWFMDELSPHITATGKGVVVVVPPWNFPIAIPCGGIAAALAAGNTVILKPASDAVLPAWELCQCFWRAGISKKTLQFLPCSGSQEGAALVKHDSVSAVILTGGTETALHMLRAKPELPLSAETGGKNATIITALADRDLAIKNVLHSAFSHGGQKCSATSLLLLEAEVYDDPDFLRALVEAASSLTVGSAWDLNTKIGPLIRPPSGDLKDALEMLVADEIWALKPESVEDNPQLWTPGIKWNVQRGSRTHLTEFFGPMLGVIRYETLAEAIAIVNETGYGLTSGLESLDDREQSEWQADIRAGNLYINRSTVGAVVLRQPFGGMGKSAFGPGLKAGGPNYVCQFMQFQETLPTLVPSPEPEGHMAAFLQTIKELDTLSLGENSRLAAALSSYEQAWESEFSRRHDHFKLIGQDNLRLYQPVPRLCIRLHGDDTPFDIYARAAAACITESTITISFPPGFESQAISPLRDAADEWPTPVIFMEESDAELAAAITEGKADRIRYAGPGRVPLNVRQAAIEAQVYIAEEPVMIEGRLELLRYLQEQSLSFDYHRYGNLGTRTPLKKPA